MDTRQLVVNGHIFHYSWLRDNCLCPACRHPENFSKLFDIGELTERPVPKQVLIDDNTLTVAWDDLTSHRSVYPIRWLMTHAYDTAMQPSRSAAIETWDCSTWSAVPPEVFPMRESEVDGGRWAQHLYRYGFARFDEITEPKLDQFVSAIGPIQHTEFGRFITVKAMTDVKDLTTTGHGLDPHTDFSTYLHMQPLLQFMLFMENEAIGGESIFVDGFKVAEDFRADHPDYFERLVRTPINFQQIYTDWRYFLRRSRPVVEVDSIGAITGVFFAHSHTATWHVPVAEMEEYYVAYNAFFGYLKNQRYQLRMRLQAGQCIAIQNGRLLHGRTAYKPASGARSLIDAFVPWEYFEARRRFHDESQEYTLAGAFPNLGVE